MPRFNFYLILFVLFVYALTAGVTLRDRLLISTLHRIERNAYVEPSAKDLFEGAMAGMAEVLSDKFGDGYSLYVPPGRQMDYRDLLENQYEGLGLSIRLHEEGEEKKFLIGYPYHDSPAYRAGLRSGDQVLQIDGVSVADKAKDEFFKLLRQQERSEIILSVLPFGEIIPKDFLVRRERIHFDSVEGDYCDSDGRVFCLETYPKIGYVRITSFSTTTAKEFGNALERMMQSGAESFILDLRNNPGGDVWNCIQVVRMLIAPNSGGNVIVMSQYRAWQFRRGYFNLIEGTQRCILPMVVLINGESASSTEILAAALQDHQRATIVGTRSFGKGVIQGIFDLPFQSGILQLTDSEYRRPNGTPIHRKTNAADSDDWGITPDKIIETSETEQSAVEEYRLLRSNILSVQRLAVLEQFRQQITVKQNNENKKEALEQKQFEFTGTAPYYDLQLDEAIKILLGNNEQ